MIHAIRVFALVALLVLTAGTLSAGLQLSQEEIKRIQDAAPATSTVKPKQPRLLLVFSFSQGYRHSAIPRASRALEILGKKTGAFETVESEDLSVFRPENLKRFDGVCFNNTTQLTFEDPVLRKSLLDFITEGKGIVGIHAATDNFPTWPEGQELLGGVFEDHPWTADGTWAVKIDDPTHPLTAAFGGKGFVIKDEIYRIRQMNLRKNSRVLLGLDMKAEQNRKAKGVKSVDRDIPISWVKTYGKGRLFYCSLGHNDEVYANSAVLRHYLDGIQFALGDLQAETTPLPFDPMSFYDQRALTDLLGRISTYTHGDSRAALSGLDEFIRGVDDLPEARLRMEKQFLEFLKGSATPAGKQFICMRLALVGSEASVPQLAGMLADTATAEMALFALESIQGPAADAALQQALVVHKGRTLIGVITALGNRRVEGATAALQDLTAHPDARVAVAAVSALGKIGTPAALDALERSKKSAKGEVRSSIAHAMLACAGRMKSQGEKDRAAAVYTSLGSPDEPVAVRSAALRGTILNDPGNAAGTILTTLRSGDAALHPIAAQLVGKVPDIEGVRAIAGALPEFTPAAQAQVLASFAAYRDAGVQKAVVAATAARVPDVRIAALRTAGSMGDAGAVSTLARAAASSTGAEQKEARSSLYALRGAGVDDSILVMLPRVDGRTKVELLKAIAERRITAAVPSVLQAAGNPSGPVRIESARTLKSLAGAEHLPAMIDLLTHARGETERREWELAVAAAARRIPDRARQDEAVLAAYARTKDKQARASLISVLGKIEGPASLTTLRTALKDPDPEIRLAAIRALAGWSAADPYPDLWAVAQGAKESGHRVLALRGSVRLIGLDSTSGAEQTVRRYKEAMALAPNAAERKLLLSAVGKVPSIGALRMAASYLNDAELRPEAEAAILNIAEGIADTARPETVRQLRQLMASSGNDVNVKKADALIKNIERLDDYITSWDFAGPYEEKDARLLEKSFPPEEPAAASVQWTAFRGMTDAGRPWLLECDKAFGPGDGVVYLRTNVWSPVDQKVTLEAGSDYGIKIWVNTTRVHTNSAVRNVAPGTDRVPATLQKGWNILMMKLEQGDGSWGACLRVRTPDGGKLEGIRISTTQN